MSTIRFVLSAAVALATSSAVAQTSLLTVVGASGEPTYQTRFEQAANTIINSLDSKVVSVTTVGLAKAQQSDRDLIQDWLAAQPQEDAEPLWIVLIGHGTFDGRSAKFNLRGPDLSAGDLADWLNGIQRPVVVVNTASCSGPFINALSGENRVIITATKSGAEENATYFAAHFAHALTEPSSDLDHDDEVSLKEAFLKASADVAKFFENEDRLASEHALLDDNADSQGTPAPLMAKADLVAQSIDGHRASRLILIPSKSTLQLSPERIRQRDQLERQLEELKLIKSTLPEQQYFDRLEEILLKLAVLYQTKSS